MALFREEYYFPLTIQALSDIDNKRPNLAKKVFNPGNIHPKEALDE
jgi:hypothetical protein